MVAVRMTACVENATSLGATGISCNRIYFNLIFIKTPQNCYQLKRLVKQPSFIHSLSTILFDSKEVRETTLMHLSQVYKGYINLALTLKCPRGQTGPFYAQRHV